MIFTCSLSTCHVSQFKILKKSLIDPPYCTVNIWQFFEPPICILKSILLTIPPLYCNLQSALSFVPLYWSFIDWLICPNSTRWCLVVTGKRWGLEVTIYRNIADTLKVTQSYKMIFLYTVDVGHGIFSGTLMTDYNIFANFFGFYEDIPLLNSKRGQVEIFFTK